MNLRLKLGLCTLLAALLSSPSAFACAACYGQSDSAMAQGMNWGIFSLMAVIGAVLAGISLFFVFIIRREAARTAESNSATPAAATTL